VAFPEGVRRKLGKLRGDTGPPSQEVVEVVVEVVTEALLLLSTIGGTYEDEEEVEVLIVDNPGILLST
jgi:hypothetical protein